MSRTELLAAGVPPSTVTRLLQRGVLVEVHRGVYRVASVPESPQGDVLAATKAAGDHAVASHLTAAALWNLGDLRLAPPYHVTSPKRSRKRLEGVAVHHATLDRLDRTLLGVIPVTMVPRTVIDAAGCMPDEAEVDDLVIEGLRSGHATGGSLRDALERAGTVPGAGRVRLTLSHFDAASAAQLASRMEGGFLRVFVDGGLPRPSVNRRIVEHDGLFIAKTDFGWEPPGVHVECDSIRFHATITQKQHDDARQNRIVLPDRIVLRYSYADLADPERVVAEVRRALDLAWGRRNGVAGL